MSLATMTVRGDWERQLEGNPETDLLRRARSGDPAAAEELFTVHLKGSRAIRSLLRRALANPADREEMLHEIYMALVGGSNTFRGEARLSTYVYQVARITIFQRYRRENTLKRRATATSMVDCVEIADGAASPESLYERKQNRQRVGRMIDGLPNAYREALRLRVLRDLTYEEIAAEMHLPVNTVSTKIHKGKKLLASIHETGRRLPLERMQGI